MRCAKCGSDTQLVQYVEDIFLGGDAVLDNLWQKASRELRPSTIRDFTIAHVNRDLCDWLGVWLEAHIQHSRVQFSADFRPRTSALEGLHE